MTQSTDWLVGFSAGASACVYIYKQVFTMVREKNGNGNGKVKTFAQDPEHYWDSMRRNVTEPLAKILEEQVKGNKEVLMKLVAMEARSRRS